MFIWRHKIGKLCNDISSSLIMIIVTYTVSKPCPLSKQIKQTLPSCPLIDVAIHVHLNLMTQKYLRCISEKIRRSKAANGEDGHVSLYVVCILLDMAVCAPQSSTPPLKNNGIFKRVWPHCYYQLWIMTVGQIVRCHPDGSPKIEEPDVERARKGIVVEGGAGKDMDSTS